jgi:2-polyprenyl-6-methoxyphenol hydroxylase-like FAD-dependent oxidoreductase
VVARFDDGSSETGDFLVGADGVHSRVRAWMHPDHAKALMPLFAQGYENDQRTLKELGAFGMWMRDTVLMPLFAPMIGKALTKVYAGDPALAAKAA